MKLSVVCALIFHMPIDEGGFTWGFELSNFRNTSHGDKTNHLQMLYMYNGFFQSKPEVGRKINDTGVISSLRLIHIFPQNPLRCRPKASMDANLSKTERNFSNPTPSLHNIPRI
jgi:hypothetical protein